MSAIGYISYVCTITGCALIGIGIGMAIFEMMTIKPSPQRKSGAPKSPANIMRRVSVSSIVIIGIGVILVAVCIG